MDRIYISYRYTASKSFESRFRVNPVKAYNSFYNASIDMQSLHKLAHVDLDHFKLK